MAFPLPPEHTKGVINRAGINLVAKSGTEQELDKFREVINQWRASHAYPINTFQKTLRDKVRPYDGAIVAQRLKRMPTIIDKLQRYPEMNLSRMQDIGGVRAVLTSIDDVRRLAHEYKNNSHFEHELIRSYDYINNPRPDDGYRSIHLVYKYKNSHAQGKKYNGLLLELQIRSRLQHTWATAVETMGTFLGQALKSRRGEVAWLNFFTLASSAFAHIEGSSPVPGYESMSKSDIYEKLIAAEIRLGVIDKLRGLAIAADTIHFHRGETKWFYHLIILNSYMHTVDVISYSRDQLDDAADEYSNAEQRARNGEKIEPVLVSAGRLGSLRHAYPNYFLDANEFIENINKIKSEI